VAPSSPSWPTRAILVMVALAATAIACGPGATPNGGTSATSSPSSSGATVTPVPSGPPPSLAGRDAPPDAVLAADGGDPVTGQLGTFVWFDSASDAPWLPGAPLRVGAGEPLTLRLAPEGGITGWSARYVPAAAQGPEGAKELGKCTGSIAFGAPGPGDWTVEVSIEFDGGAGEAHYFWRLEVE
jgi:hypothetical protein